jgi:hypothetical protein
MEIANVRGAFEHPLPIKLKHEAQSGVRRRVLRSEIERPAVLGINGGLIRAERVGVGFV